MLYLLLIIPHLVAIAGLLGYALRCRPLDPSEDSRGGSSGTEGEPKPPPQPPPAPPTVGGPPLEHATPPGRRLRDAERLADLHPRRTRREHPTPQPGPAPKTSSDALSERRPL